MDIKDTSDLDLILSALYMKVMKFDNGSSRISYSKIFDSVSRDDSYGHIIRRSMTRKDYENITEVLNEKTLSVNRDNKLVISLINVMVIASTAPFLKYHIIRSDRFKSDVLKVNGRNWVGAQTPWLKGSVKSNELYDFLLDEIGNQNISHDFSMRDKIIRNAEYLFRKEINEVSITKSIKPINWGDAQTDNLNLQAPPPDDYTCVNIYWGTNRASDIKMEVYEFTDERNNQTEEQLRVGRSYITIPKSHETGVIERPEKWLGVFKRGKENDSKHIVIHGSELMNKNDWLTAFASGHSQDEALLFIHGYNCSFNDALYRAAQLKYDLKFNGPTFSFNWASRAKVVKYNSDEETIKWSKHHLEEMIDLILSSNQINKLHIVAHSMGNRALVDLVDKWSTGKNKIHTLILAAPDVDVDVIKSIESNFSYYHNVTLYSSDSDMAVALSSIVHDNRRAGNSSPPCVFNNIQTVDASSIKRPIFSLGHSYFADTMKVFTDMYYLLKNIPVLDRVNIKENVQMKYYYIT